MKLRIKAAVPKKASTRALVGKKLSTGVLYIYVHNDGYPSYLGEILKTNYRNPAKVDKMLALGNASILGAELEAPTSIFYKRDRGEQNQDATRVSWREFQKESGDYDFIYIYDPATSQWMWSEPGDALWNADSIEDLKVL